MLIGTTAFAGAAAGGGSGAGTACNGIAGVVASGANASIPGNGQGGGGVDCSSTGVSGGSVKTLAAKIVNIFSIIVGAASIIMIIYGGFRYIISGGQSERVGAAKNSLIYAIVGLVIVALAQLIVHFVLYQSSNLSSGNGVSTITRRV
ncbi:MAG TPA: pilin [Candidatus Saccharimonadales bacterium]|nr:pilin [Candidatus Saccharimonadales bacterium]